MDVRSKAVADIGILHVKDAAGAPMYDGDKPVRIHLYSPGSKQAAIVEARQTARTIKRMQENDGKMSLASAEVRLQEATEDLADMTSHFENLEYDDKQGRALLEAVYSDRSIGFIAAQVQKYLVDWGNFPRASATS